MHGRSEGELKAIGLVDLLFGGRMLAFWMVEFGCRCARRQGAATYCVYVQSGLLCVVQSADLQKGSQASHGVG